jgi:hypothetical protein
MRKRRIGSVAIATAVLVGMLASPAFALVTGWGRTSGGAYLRLVARKDLTGHLRYVNHDVPFAATCSKYTSYKTLNAPTGVRRVRVLGTCTRSDGKRVYFKGVFRDTGRHGDSARLWFKRLKKTAWKNAPIKDGGPLLRGKIKITH